MNMTMSGFKNKHSTGGRNHQVKTILGISDVEHYLPKKQRKNRASVMIGEPKNKRMVFNRSRLNKTIENLADLEPKGDFRLEPIVKKNRYQLDSFE